ncbi:DNA polymerase III subunit gamma/tau [Rubrivirga sp. S365]|uniref:DNA polymerase III subunit gamma/tau n=1 Tax=Rubrivirga litoralis TaxID=3075598 RepID=A0ABU3BT10_9BACT|nr:MULTISPECIES: DNA polymerase III subunit gamma/tau [unclassified Rubrivirga]MDT0632408.1 DNA polymerase III subunit gamma/tau [Rubrivirga sp. F394]MDT7855221.1 DNA polymerase III subunit gamma/tau [Rubrivirga sp. S365]
MADTPAPRYLVTARKYRPQTFGDLVAQEHVAQTLRNAITSGRLAHAYLFSGPRGVGKTTAARILAKAVNCQTPLDQRPDAEPCRTCDSCLAFEAGRSLNVIEIDAASNNRVEDIRELRDTVRVPPQGADKKVYILDEVHMLSASAFNALLKTLEEPPPYALFIFATTEPHKVLPTILSRTQRFDFRRIAVPEIVGRLRAICEAEGVRADDESLVLLARKGDGALRDALSLFDQALSLCGDTVEIGPLREALGVVDADLYFAATDRARAGDRAGLLDLVEHVVQSGHDLNEFVLGLADHVRNLLVARATGSGALIEGTEATRDRYLRAAGPYAEADLLHLLLLSDGAASDLRESRQPRLTLELALLKMASLESALDLGRLIDRLDGLEAAARDGALAAPASAPAAPPPAAPAASTAPPSAPAASAAAPSAGAPASSAAPPSVPAPSAAPPSAPAAPPASEPAASPAAQTSEPPAGYAARPPAAAPPSAGGAVPEPPASAEPAPSAPPRPPAAPPQQEQPPPHTDRDDPMGGRGGDDGGVPRPPRPAPAPPPAGGPPAAAPRPAPARPGGALFGRPALRRPSGGDGQTGGAATLAVPDAPSATGGAAPAEPIGPALGQVQDAWPRFVEAVRAEVGVRVGAIVQGGRALRVRRGAVEVGLDDDFACRVADEHAAVLADVLMGVLGGEAPPVRYVVAPAEALETGAPADPFDALKQMRQEHPVVRALFERFGAEIVWQ